jgi:hypothetical protein
MALKAYGSAYRQCYSWLGPNQPGVSTTDPTDPSAAVPDPGGAPPGQKGVSTSAAKLTVADVLASARAAKQSTPTSTTGASTSAPSSSSSSSASSSSTSSSGPAIDLHKTIGQIVAGAAGAGSSGSGVTSGSSGSSSSSSSGSSGSSSSSSSAPTSGQAQQLLNYLLAP